MSDEEGHDEEDAVGASEDEASYEMEPTKQEKIEMRKAIKPPSEWLKLLCRDWSIENEVLVETADAKFLDYKPYLKGLLTSQLLCRLSIPPNKGDHMEHSPPLPIDFWEILGVNDAFDRSYIVAQIERFCSLYSIRAISLDEQQQHSTPSAEQLFGTDDPASIAAAAAAGINVSPTAATSILNLPSYIDPTAAAAAACAAAAAVHDGGEEHREEEDEEDHDDDADDEEHHKHVKRHAGDIDRARLHGKNDDKNLVNERKQTYRKEQRRILLERKEQKHREREEMAAQKASERAHRDATREDRRRRKLELRLERERFAHEQKEAALKRAAELVVSNRVPIEITRGVAAAKAAQASFQEPIQAVVETRGNKKRSAVVVSTALDLHQIVTHAKNLWSKYNAIAREHNQKVNWITVARELGIHVKVREKYARMHNRAEQRGFDWQQNGHWKIKDYPEIFLDPTTSEKKAKMPPPTDTSRTVLIDGTKEATEQAVAAAAAVVDASVNHQSIDHVVQTTDEQAAAAAAVAATLVADPTAGSYDDSNSLDKLERIAQI